MRERDKKKKREGERDVSELDIVRNPIILWRNDGEERKRKQKGWKYRETEKR